MFLFSAKLSMYLRLKPGLPKIWVCSFFCAFVSYGPMCIMLLRGKTSLKKKQLWTYLRHSPSKTFYSEHPKPHMICQAWWEVNAALSLPRASVFPFSAYKSSHHQRKHCGSLHHGDFPLICFHGPSGAKRHYPVPCTLELNLVNLLTATVNQGRREAGTWQANQNTPFSSALPFTFWHIQGTGFGPEQSTTTQHERKSSRSCFDPRTHSFSIAGAFTLL